MDNLKMLTSWVVISTRFLLMCLQTYKENPMKYCTFPYQPALLATNQAGAVSLI